MAEGWHAEPVGLAHTAVLVALYGQCFDDPWSTESMAAVLNSPGCFAFIARSPSGPPGGFALARLAGDEVELISLGVLPGERRRGIGGILLGAVMERALGAQARRVVLEVAETNDAARGLYLAYGFVAVGRRPDYYQRANSVPVAALTMAREIFAASPTSL